MSPNHREVLYAISTITGQSEYVSSTNHVLNTSGSGGGGGSGGTVTIADGVNPAILTTVFNLTNSKPLATQNVDSTGTAVALATLSAQIGGGQKTQIVDGSGNVIGATSNALDINIKSGSIANTSFIATQATAANLNATVVGTGTFAVQAAQSGTWNVGASSATGSAVPANAHYIGINSGGNLTGASGAAPSSDSIGSMTGIASIGYPTLYNGTNFSRTYQIANALNSTGTGVQAVGLVAQVDDTSPTAITENQFGNVRMSTARALLVVQKSSTSTPANVSTSTTNTTLLSANVSRNGGSVYNDAAGILYVKFGTTASATDFKVALAAGAYYEIPAGYTGRIDGILSTGTGTARVAEES